MTASTSFRISETARTLLSTRAAAERVSVTALLERLIIEGIQALDHPGIVFRGAPGDRRAAVAGGPDVWEVVARLRELMGPEEHRIDELSEETGVHPRMIRAALDYAADHDLDVRARIQHHEEMVERSRRAVERREALLG